MSLIRHLCRAFLLVLALVGGIGAAHGHAQFLGADPADGAVLAAAPPAVTLSFGEPVSVIRLALVGPDGHTSELAGAAAGGSVRVELPSGLSRGTHLLSWRVVSADGHPVGGTTSFSVAAASVTRAVAGGPAVPVDLAAALVIARTLLLLSLAGAVGGAILAALCPGATWTARLLRPARAAATALPLAALAALAVQGADALGLGLAGALSLAALEAGAATAFGVSALAAALAGPASAVAIRRGAGAGRAAGAAAAFAALLAAATFGASGHAASAAPRPATAIAVAAHGFAAVFWLGALWPLLRLLRDPTRDPSPALRRFSAMAVPMVGLLLATGGFLAIVQVGSSEAVATTAYGRLLLVKLVLVAGLLSAAALNRTVLTPRLADGDGSARAALVRVVAVELGLAVLLLAVVAGWRLTPPPRATAAAAPAVVSLHLHGAAVMADVTLTPARAGTNRIELALQTGDFGPLDPREVELAFVPESGGIEPVARMARRDVEGRWTAENLPLPVAGRWSVTIGVLVDDFRKETLTGTLEIRR